MNANANNAAGNPYLFDKKGLVDKILENHLAKKLISLGYARKADFLGVVFDLGDEFPKVDFRCDIQKSLINRLVDDPEERRILWWATKKGLINIKVKPACDFFDQWSLVYSSEKCPTEFKQLYSVILPKLFHRMDLEIEQISLDFISIGRKAQDEMLPMINTLASQWEAQVYKSFGLATGCWNLSCS